MLDVYIDTREKKYVHEAFKKNLQGGNYNSETLPLGDIVIGNIVIERKSINDLYGSIIKGNLFEQLRHMAEFRKDNPDVVVMLLIEKGRLSIENRRYYKMWNLNMIILNAIQEFGMLAYVSENIYGTVKFINDAIKYSNVDNHIIKRVRGYKRKNSLYDKKKFVLMGLPTVGDKTSDKILEKHETLMEYFNTLEGKKTKVSEVLYR